MSYWFLKFYALLPDPVPGGTNSVGYGLTAAEALKIDHALVKAGQLAAETP
ncbi:hypothetical protein Atai01_79170 [Amycolatopsis taiwanensis]|uniref:Uncharacterized protein n=1 Tax=Amycolatopsis taiwanensis TaxID=342230 RepID=A0A9W6R8P4_9PSEU|nr:hypothetical protein Atai01_79170 [Amycolatopsis taiwanensis]